VELQTLAVAVDVALATATPAAAAEGLFIAVTPHSRDPKTRSAAPEPVAESVAATVLRRSPWLAGCVGALGLAGCALPRPAIDAHEDFNSSSTYSRTYAALDVQTCEAARRTLLSQGYVISVATADQVRGRKSFQPVPETHVEVEFNIVCAKDGYAGRRTIAFVNAVQDRYALKKSNNSASLGVGAFGSLSLPFTGSDESLVKIASATITSAPFYERFFRIVERYLAGDPGQQIAPLGELTEPEVLPVKPAPPASGALQPLPSNTAGAGRSGP
jgi:hypothetical protein